jgi:hypothetical protein
MTDTQLYLAIGVPIVVNILFNGAMLLLVYHALSQRIDDMDKLFSERLRRVEEVFDARLSHIEDKLGIR